jgi:hypothetical protein
VDYLANLGLHLMGRGRLMGGSVSQLRRSRVGGLATLLASTVLLAACGGSGSDAQPPAKSTTADDGIRLPVDPKTRSAYPAALVKGRLDVTDPAANPACLVLVTAENERWSLVWPQGFSAFSSPLSVRSAVGAVVATVGSVVALGGGEWQLGDVRDDTCPSGQPHWMVSP